MKTTCFYELIKRPLLIYLKHRYTIAKHQFCPLRFWWVIPRFYKKRFIQFTDLAIFLKTTSKAVVIAFIEFNNNDHGRILRMNLCPFLSTDERCCPSGYDHFD
jgi:hypothetical protein